MRKHWILSMLASVSIFFVVLLFKRNNRKPMSEYFPLKSAGKPDQTDRIDNTQLENSKMVSEGSLYGVQYYNEMAEEHQ